MQRSRVIAAAVVTVALAGVAAVWFYRRAEARDAPAYRFATVERGNIETTVSATGALSAVRTVQVGTQVSGQLSQIYVDFNDRVKKGQLLARIDPTLQEQAVRDAQAGLERSDAELAQARREHDRNVKLFESRVLAAAELEATASKVATAEASRKSAQVAVDRARRNLSYTSIYAPINGVVVERNVDVGQTVAASLSAPQLFLIANDLARMQILASVDESDIGAIREGAPVRFTVQSYAADSFTGEVRQVRLQSTTRENVVTYTVVVAVRNPEARLLPGMTATTRFVTDSAIAVLTVPNAALRFRPAGATAAVTAAQPVRAGDSAVGSRAVAAGVRRAGDAGQGPSRGTGQGKGKAATLWYLDASGEVVGAPVLAGISDGQRTAVDGEGIEAGMRVIVGLVEAGAVSTTNSTNPLQPTANGPRRPGGF